MKEEIIYIEHYAGGFEDGLQICIHCGAVICDYTGHVLSADGSSPKGFPVGKIYVTGTNPVEWTIIEPLPNYGGDDPYTRTIVKCMLTPLDAYLST